MNTILVTGGAGFIGSNFVRYLLANYEFQVINLDKLTYAGSRETITDILDHPRHEFVQGDIADGELVGQLLRRHQCDAIVNFAAESHVDRSIGYPLPFVQANVVGTFELLEAALRYWEGLAGPKKEGFRFLQISTDEVYGSLGSDGIFTEETPYAPNSPYSASKASGDHFVRAYHKTYGLPTMTTHSSNNYGPHQLPEKLIPLMILNALEGAPLPVYGTGGNVRDWLHVEDHCRGLLEVLEKAACGEVYNLGGNCEVSNLDVVHMICDTIDRLCPSSASCRDRIQFVQDRPGHDFRYAIDCTKIASHIGWEPQISFSEGMEQTVQWYMERRDQFGGGVHRERQGEGHSP